MVSRRKTRKLRKQRGGQSQLVVQFKNKSANGSVFLKNLTKNAPKVNYKGTGLYTLLMWDPDAPAKSWLHWLVINMEGADVKRGDEIISYTPPSPPSGTHRYFITLYSQKGPYELIEPPKERGYFNMDAFVQENQLLKVGEAMVQVSAEKN
jgi:phosphatidylethanolamine-binding protein (PEBP) family uncharacterized protein